MTEYMSPSKHTGGSSPQLPQPQENDERLRDLHKPGPEHILEQKTDQTVPSYSESFLNPVSSNERTIPYDKDFFENTPKASKPKAYAYYDPLAAEKREQEKAKDEEKASEIADTIKLKANRASMLSIDYQYPIPNRIEAGAHLGAGIVKGKPVAIGMFSNTSGLEIADDQTARIGVAAVRYGKNSLDVNMLDFQIVSPEQKKQLPQLLSRARKNGGLSKMNLPDKEAGQLNLDIKLEAYSLELMQTPGSRSICFIIRGKNINKISGTSSESLTLRETFSLEQGDIILAVSNNLLRSLVQKMTRNSAEGLPDDFVEAEGALQLQDLIRESLKTARSTSADSNGQPTESKHLSPQLFFDKINDKIKEDFRNSDNDNVSVESFFVYQVP